MGWFTKLRPLVLLTDIPEMTQVIGDLGGLSVNLALPSELKQNILITHSNLKNVEIYYGLDFKDKLF